MPKDGESQIGSDPIESSQKDLQTPPTDTISIGIAVILAILITLLFIVLGFPPLRDWLLSNTNIETRTWVSSNKSTLLAWIDWLRIVFEIALALFISNQVFNDPLRKWFERSLDTLRHKLTSKTEASIKGDDARVKIRKALNEVFAFMYLPGDIRQLPSDMKILSDASLSLYHELRYGILYLFLRLFFLRVLSAFSGKLHATAALIAFWAVLLMKVSKLYLDSPILSGIVSH